MHRRTHNSSQADLEDNSSISSAASSKRVKSQRGSLNSLEQIYYYIVALILLCLFFFFYLLPNHNNAEAERLHTLAEIKEYQEMAEGLKRELDMAKKQVLTAEGDLKRKNTELMDLIEKNNKEKERKEKEEKEGVDSKEIEEENSILKEHIDRYTSEIQAISKRNAEEKFGKGPHKVEIALDFPPETPFEVSADTNTKFIIEMAPLDLMPHSVNFFLEQVSRKLLDGTSFHRNAGHVVQGGPVVYFNTPAEKKNRLRSDFQKYHLNSVSFQEYSADFPHKKYTVGFAGRPGGPDWYVSVKNNVLNHGPGGQGGYKVKSEADPCFGKVIAGFDAVELMHKMPKKEGWYEGMKFPVGIKYAKILE